MLSKALSSLLLLVLLLCSGSSVLAQQDPQTPMPGTQASHPYQMGDIDQVDLATGNVIVNIPILGFDQKGDLTLHYSLMWSGKTQNVIYYVMPSGCPIQDNDSSCDDTGETFDYWSDSSIGMHMALNEDLSPSQMTFANGYYVVYEGTEPSNGYTVTATSPDGNTHVFMQDVSNSAYWADDTSGYRTSGNAIVDRMGILHRPLETSNSLLQDAHGNRITYSNLMQSNGVPYTFDPNYIDDGFVSGTLTDTVGRTLPWWPVGKNPLGSSTSDYSGCTGSRPIASATLVYFPGVYGSQLAYKLCYVTFKVNTYYNQINYPTMLPTEIHNTVSYIQSVVMPNKTAWTFEYDGANDSSSIHYGDLLSIASPTGALISYKWFNNDACTGPCNLITPISRTLQSRTVDLGDGVSHTWQYHYGMQGNTPYTEVDGPNENAMSGHTIETHYFGGGGGGNYPGFNPGEETRATYADSTSGVVIKDVRYSNFLTIGGELTDFYGNYQAGNPSYLPQQTDTYLGASLATQTKTYPAGPQINLPLGGSQGNGSIKYPLFLNNFGITFGTPDSVTQKDYDGSVLSTVVDTLAFTTSPTIYMENKLDLLQSESILDPKGTPLSTTTNTFDTYDHNPAGTSSCLASDDSSVGNICNTSSGGTVKSFQYDSAGDVAITYDGLDHPTSFVRDSSGLFVSSVIHPQTGTTLHREWWSVDLNTGLPISHVDENGAGANDSAHMISYTYDAVGRLLTMKAPQTSAGTPQVTYCYTDASNTCPDGSTPYSVYSSQPNGTQTIKAVNTYNGFGDLIQRAVTTSATGAIYTRTIYDGLRRASTVWNPSQCNPTLVTSCPGEATWGTTVLSYDALNRKVSQQQQDGTSKRWSYSNNVLDVYDEIGNDWQQTVDAQGRLTKVVEKGSTASPLSQETDYSYDARSNLVSVNQLGQNGDLARLRTFHYDALSRLTTAQNPETGLVCYGTWSGGTVGSGTCQNGYDANGNLKVRTDAKGAQTNFSYDWLNRLLSKGYTNAPAGSVSSCYEYDSAINGIGRVAASWTQAGSCAVQLPAAGFVTSRQYVAYDALGHLTKEQQCVPGKCAAQVGSAFIMNYGYDLLGNVTSMDDGIGQIAWTSVFDAASRLSTITAAAIQGIPNPAQLFTAQSYNPAGGLTGWTLGSIDALTPALTGSRAFDNRLRISTQTVTGHD